MLTNAMIYEYNLPKFYTIVTFIRWRIAVLRILTICFIETTTKVKQRQPLACIVHLTQSVSVYIEKQEHVSIRVCLQSTLKNKNTFMISMVSSIRYMTDILEKPSNKQNYWPQYSAKLWCEFQLVKDESTVIIIHHPHFEEYLTNWKEFRQSKTRYQKLSSSSIRIMQKIKAERSKLYRRSTQDNSPVNPHLQRQFQLAIRVRDDDTLWRMAIQRLTITYHVPLPTLLKDIVYESPPERYRLS